MKIVQIVEGYVWMSPYTSLAELPPMEPTILERFKEAPDNVQDNWFYNYQTGEFSAPTLPEGYEYDAFGVPFPSTPAAIAEQAANEAILVANEADKKAERVLANQDIIQEAIDTYTLQLIEGGLL